MRFLSLSFVKTWYFFYGIVGTTKSTATDTAGKFKMMLPNTNNSQILIFSVDGYLTKEYLHNVNRPGREIAIRMSPDKRWDKIRYMVGGAIGCGIVIERQKPKEIARDIWWLLTGHM